MGDSVLVIKDGVLRECTDKNVESVEIPAGVKRIGPKAFCDCASLRFVTIPDSVTRIDVGAFWDCEALTEVDLPDSVTIIEKLAFSGSGLTRIRLSNNLQSIGSEAFRGCRGLKEIVFPESLVKICENAFFYCMSLKEIVIPAGVCVVAPGAFALTRIKKMSVAKGNPVYDSREDCNAIIETKSNELVAASQSAVIPGSVTSIGPAAFYGVLMDADEICIPDGVTHIGFKAFGNNRDIGKLHIGANVERIDDSAFCECFIGEIDVDPANKTYDSRKGCNGVIETALDKLIIGGEKTTFPDGLKEIGESVFEAHQGRYRFKTIRLPSTLQRVGKNAFYSCPALETIEYNGTPEELARLDNLPQGAKVVYYSKDWKAIV